MFKHKIIKYFLISALVLCSLILIAILRLSYKPLDITYFSNSYPLFNKKVSEYFDIKSKKVFIEINILKNELSIKVDNIFLQNLNSNISNVRAKEANITFRLTDIIKNKIEANNIAIINGGLDIYDIENLSEATEFKNNNKKYAFNNILFEKININIYENNKKIAILTNSNLALTKSKEGIRINNLLIDNLVLKDFNNENKFIFNNLKLIKKNKPNYTFKIENIEIQNKDYFLKNQYFKNISNLILKDIIFNFDSASFFTDLRGQIYFNDYSNQFVINGTIKSLKKFDGDLTLNINNFPIFSLLKNNLYKENKYKINNISSVLFNGKLKVVIKDSVLDKASIKIFSKLYENEVFITNLKNNSQINIKDISLEGEIKNNLYEIKNLNINKDKQNLKIYGKFYNKFKNYFLNINAEEIKYNNINKFLNDSLDANLKYFDGISSLNIENIRNLNLILSKNNNNTEFTIINSDFENIKLITKEKMILNISSAKVIKKKKNIKLYSSSINVEGLQGSSYLSSLSLLSNDYTDINNNLELKTNISTDYKFLNLILSEFDINQNFPKSLEGEVSGFLKISKKQKDEIYGYLFEGTLKNFNYVQTNNEDIPIVLNEFNGKIFLSNNIVKIEGIGDINGSSSDIKILVDKNNLLTANIESQAKPSSFNFLGKYNFIQKGNSKLKILITKDFNEKKWQAKFNANLFSNEIKIDFINFYKPIKRRANISGALYFDELDLIQIDKLDFVTEQLLVSANFQFNDQNNVERILINRFIKDKNNFKANIKFVEDEYSLVNVQGESLDFKSIMSYGNGELSNISLNLNVDNVYYDNIFFGRTFIESQIKNNHLLKLKGNISNNKGIYIKFENNLEEQSELNQIKIKFDDFGGFLKKSSLYESFLEGQGSATLYLRKLSLLSGRLEINNSSIKNSSFLARLLQLASFTGLLEILTNEGIPFDRIDVNFTKKNSIIEIEEANFQGFSLGGNLKGFTELDKQELNLEGIIVPAYAINAFLNKIPLIGQVITGIEGDGLIGVNFKVTGNYDKPNYNVNPLSILTPGILRSIFDSFFEVNNEDETIE